MHTSRDMYLINVGPTERAGEEKEGLCELDNRMTFPSYNKTISG
jgi:hypothetical protein